MGDQQSYSYNDPRHKFLQRITLTSSLVLWTKDQIRLLHCFSMLLAVSDDPPCNIAI
jgi:hypothetical protein